MLHGAHASQRGYAIRLGIHGYVYKFNLLLDLPQIVVMDFLCKINTPCVGGNSSDSVLPIPFLAIYQTMPISMDL